jgi:hypothetical protein
MLAPEAVLYQRGPNDQMRLVAVEWVVDAAAWDALYNDPPTLLGQTFPRNNDLGVYGLHAWVWRNNPSGMFASWNPEVSCP